MRLPISRVLLNFYFFSICSLLVSCSQIQADVPKLSTEPIDFQKIPSLVPPTSTTESSNPLAGQIKSFPTATQFLQASPSQTPVPVPLIELPISLPENIPPAEVRLDLNFKYLKATSSNLAGFRTVGGIVEIIDASFWNKFQEYYPTLIMENQGAIVRFMLSPSSEMRAFLETTTSSGSDLRWGVIVSDIPVSEGLQNNTEIGGDILKGGLAIVPNHWYYLLLLVDDTGSFSTLIWDSEKPDLQVSLTQQFPSDWQGNRWNFYVRGKSGSIFLDKYIIIALSSVK